MPQKTPQFDKAFDEALNSTKPHSRTCKTCGSIFGILEGDIEMYKKLRVPPPFECSSCRMRKRMAMMANIFQFYKKECTRHPGERVVSQTDDVSPYKIYDNAFWWNVNEWDALSFGRTYDSSKPFGGQLVSLLRDVPHMALARYNKNNINSEYSVDSIGVKNSYIISTAALSENISYGVWVLSSKDSLDLLRVDHVEQCYDVTNSSRSSNVQYVRNSSNCFDSYFLFECRNCQYCFGCTNLNNKKYCFFNEQLSPEEYKKRISAIDLGSRTVRDEYVKKFEDFVSSRAVLRAVHTKNSSGSVGDELMDCKNCFWTFSAISFTWVFTFYKSENVRYSQDISGVRDVMDVTIFGPGELSYNVIEGFSVNKVIASYFVGDSMEVEYSFECFDCKYCFGCSGLKKKQYCILNRQYTPEEYWKTVDEIKTQMLRDGTYGEFLPLRDSFFYYNDTYAQAMLPLNGETAKMKDARWRGYDPKVETGNIKTLFAHDIPNNVRDVSDDILDSAIVCEVSGIPFRVTRHELEFYRKYRIPLPVKHPQVRLLERFQRKNPYELWKGLCKKCGKVIHTSYSPGLQNKNTLCEECYIKEVR